MPALLRAESSSRLKLAAFLTGIKGVADSAAPDAAPQDDATAQAADPGPTTEEASEERPAREPTALQRRSPLADEMLSAQVRRTFLPIPLYRPLVVPQQEAPGVVVSEPLAAPPQEQTDESPPRGLVVASRLPAAIATSYQALSGRRPNLWSRQQQSRAQPVRDAINGPDAIPADCVNLGGSHTVRKTGSPIAQTCQNSPIPTDLPSVPSMRTAMSSDTKGNPVRAQW